ncbi:RagB/SusD family nutrient uptake outer membrane protein [Segetibacter koreensis]|uniref:RagB/SusD family nutrient uptake outer membrane protein n=1 Tax=Segetibacter koreensis TaxID=398037 RepID=UPI00036F5089|nr:RagB/SusD family nutrient uptake outer membrane protein [Segetibacter koreensis]
MKSKIVYIFFMFCTAFLGGCEKSLDLLPPGAISEKIFWKQEKDAILGVNAIYNELDDVNMVINLDGVSDLGYVRHSWTDLYKLGMGIHDPLNAEISDTWSGYFRGIRKANDVINNVDKISDADPELIKRVKGEARFLRAYFYTNLTSLWGDVPLLVKPLEITEQVAKEKKSVIVDFINAELDEIISTDALPLAYGSTDIGRATKGAALALKARVCLRNGLWSQASAAAKAVIDLGIYSLHPNYGELFMYAGENSNEIIMSKQFAKGGLTHTAFDWGPYSIGGSSVVEPIRNLFEKYEYKGFKDAQDPYKNLDPRWGFTCYYPGSIIRTENGAPVMYNSYPSGSNTSIDKVNTQDNTSSHGWNLRKYIDYDNDKNNPDEGAIDLILIRYADVLLMYAEAKIEQNEIDQSVYNAINAVRGRPSVSMPPITSGKSQAELRELVRNERAVELAFEGLRLYDLYRWKTGEKKAGLVQGFEYRDEASGANKIWSIGINRRFQERDYLWPIPQREIDLNKKMTQNTGW